MERDSNIFTLQTIFTGKKRSTWESTGFWRELCPDLSISDEDANLAQKKQESSLRSIQEDESKRRQGRLVDDGYVLIDELIGDKRIVGKLANAVTTLHKEHSLPATFALLYDETWHLARAASAHLSASTHQDNKFNFDILAWYIDPREGLAGFSPHRDRQPEEAKSSFHDNGMAKYVTMWLALTDATPENSCLYVIPKQFDPGYTKGDDCGDGGNDSDPLTSALPDKQAYQNIRALPRSAGQCLLFTHRILHWGSRGNPNSHIKTPRIAISFVSSDPSFEKPYIDWSLIGSRLPPFKLRLLLVCAQLLTYYQRYNLPKECIKLFHDYVKDNKLFLEETYRKKVYVQFIKAMREESSLDTSKDKDNSDEEDEAVLEAMLDAEAEGYGEFEDDYDNVDGGETIEGDHEADVFEDDEGTCILFGRRDSHRSSTEDGPAKKVKITEE